MQRRESGCCQIELGSTCLLLDKTEFEQPTKILIYDYHVIKETTDLLFYIKMRNWYLGRYKLAEFK